MSKPTPDQFHMKKVSLLTSGGIDIKWTVNESVSAESHEALESVKSTKDPHGDLTQIIRQCKPWLAKVMSYSTVQAMTNHPDFAATKKQSEAAKKAYEKILEKLTVTGIDVSGTLENRGLTIRGTFKVDSKQHIKLNTHKLKADGKAFGFEGDIPELIDRLEEECYLYIYEDKRAQLELTFDEKAKEAEKEVEMTIDQIE